MQTTTFLFYLFQSFSSLYTFTITENEQRISFYFNRKLYIYILYTIHQQWEITSYALHSTFAFCSCDCELHWLFEFTLLVFEKIFVQLQIGKTWKPLKFTMQASIVVVAIASSQRISVNLRWNFHFSTMAFL